MMIEAQLEQPVPEVAHVSRNNATDALFCTKMVDEQLKLLPSASRGFGHPSRTSDGQIFFNEFAEDGADCRFRLQPPSFNFDFVTRLIGSSSGPEKRIDDSVREQRFVKAKQKKSVLLCKSPPGTDHDGPQKLGVGFCAGDPMHLKDSFGNLVNLSVEGAASNLPLQITQSVFAESLLLSRIEVGFAGQNDHTICLSGQIMKTTIDELADASMSKGPGLGHGENLYEARAISPGEKERPVT
jgi:hypothetical protein